MSFSSRGFLGSQLYPRVAGFFLEVATGSFTTAQKRALGYLVNGLTDLGISNNDGNFLIYPFLGTTAGVNALNLFSAQTTALNLTFVGSPTQNISGTSFNGTTQYAIGPSLAIYPMGLAMDDITMAVCTAGMGGGTYAPMGFFMANSLQTKTYSTAGSFTFDPNTEAPGITSFTISAWGAGGGGGGTSNAISTFPGGGAAGGGYATRAVTLAGSQLDTSISITVGTGGVTTSGNDGGAGGDSTVTHPNFVGISAGGGGQGRRNAAGTGGGGGTVGTNSGSTTFNGGGGAAGGAVVNRGGGGGGSSAGTAAIGNNGTTATSATGGAGGTAPTGGFAGGQGGNFSNGVGNIGTAGGGGGGGAGAAATGTVAGGVGGAGRVTISWTPAVFRRFSMSIFNGSGENNLDCSVTTDVSSRFTYTTTPALTNGIRIGGRRANNGANSDMGFFVQNNAGTSSAGPAVMSTTSFSPSPQFYFGASNSWNFGGQGNTAGTLYSGYLSFAMIGPRLSTTQMQSLFTLITNYNSILGRTP